MTNTSLLFCVNGLVVWYQQTVTMWECHFIFHAILPLIATQSFVAISVPSLTSYCNVGVGDYCFYAKGESLSVVRSIWSMTYNQEVLIFFSRGQEGPLFT